MKPSKPKAILVCERSCQPSKVSISRIRSANRFGISVWMNGTMSRVSHQVTIWHINQRSFQRSPHNPYFTS